MFDIPPYIIRYRIEDVDDRDLAAWCVERGLRLVLVSGAFDPLHAGHLEHLRQVRGMGDVIVVALATDIIVKIGHGLNRPVFPFHQRASMLLSFTAVHRIWKNAGPTAINAIELFRPSLYIKGPDYAGKQSVLRGHFLLREREAVERLGGHLMFTAPTLETHSKTWLRA